jgi:hypothetical protein
MQANAGTQFDAEVVRVFVAAYRDHGDPRTVSP